MWISTFQRIRSIQAMSETVRFFTGFTFTMMSVRGFCFALVCLLWFRISGCLNFLAGCISYFLGWLYLQRAGLGPWTFWHLLEIVRFGRDRVSGALSQTWTREVANMIASTFSRRRVTKSSDEGHFCPKNNESYVGWKVSLGWPDQPGKAGWTSVYAGAG